MTHAHMLNSSPPSFLAASSSSSVFRSSQIFCLSLFSASQSSPPAYVIFSIFSDLLSFLISFLSHDSRTCYLLLPLQFFASQSSIFPSSQSNGRLSVQSLLLCVQFFSAWILLSFRPIEHLIGICVSSLIQPHGSRIFKFPNFSLGSIGCLQSPYIVCNLILGVCALFHFPFKFRILKFPNSSLGSAGRHAPCYGAKRILFLTHFSL